jgi:hypothetical protein
MLIAIGKVAKMFGVTCQTIRNWEAQGIFSTSKTIGKHRRFELEEVERSHYVRKSKKNSRKTTFCVNTPKRHVFLLLLSRKKKQTSGSWHSKTRWKPQIVILPAYERE